MGGVGLVAIRDRIGVAVAVAGLLAALPVRVWADQTSPWMQVTSVASSPNGEYVYALSEYQGRVQVWLRNPESGDLTLEQSVDLSKPTDLAASADGRYLYVADQGISALKVFEISSGGTLQQVQVLQQGVGGPPTLNAPTAVVVSSDDRHVYLSDKAMNGGILGFERGLDGRLSYLQTVTQADVPIADSVPGSFTATLFDVHSLTIAPNGSALYASQGMGGAFIELDRDPQTGQLTPQKPEPFVGSPTGAGGSFYDTIAVSPDSSGVYSTQQEARGLWHSPTATGTARPERMYRNGFDGVTGMEAPDQVAVSPAGGCIVVNQNGPGASTVWFKRAGDGSLAFVASADLGQSPIGGIAFAGLEHVYMGSSLGIVRGEYDPLTCSVTAVHLPYPGGGDGGGSPQPPGGSNPSPCQFTSLNGVSINKGDPYTDDPKITLSLNLPACVDSVLISNDGGFKKAVQKAAKKSLQWTLDDSVGGRNTKIVYIRPIGTDVDTSKTFTDDVILDTRAPSLEQVSVRESGTGATATLTAASKKKVRYLVRSKATDKLSGVKLLQLAPVKKPTKGTRVKYAKSVNVAIKSSNRVFVRVRDGAGNWTKWRAVKVNAR